MPSAKKISKSQFKSHALELFRKVQLTGEAIIITDYGKPVLKIVPYNVREENVTLKSMRGKVIKYINPMEPVGQDDWEALK
jgi:antitoxin (DNA-binding transcriptional repressor) of toxin-antitoxin stability system